MPKIRKWLLTYTDGTTRVVWSEFRETLPSGVISFYNTTIDGTTAIATELLLAVAAGQWKEVTCDPSVEVGDVPTIGSAPAGPRNVRRR